MKKEKSKNKIQSMFFHKQDIIKWLKKHRYKYEEFGLTCFRVYLKHSNNVAIIHRKICSYKGDTLDQIFQKLETMGQEIEERRIPNIKRTNRIKGIIGDIENIESIIMEETISN